MARWYGYNKKNNVRVVGATQVVIDGITFDSKLEGHMYTLLRNYGKVEFTRQHKFILQPSFKSTLTGKHIREIAWFVDFYIPSLKMIIDPKGHPTEIFKQKFKIMQYKIATDVFDIDHILLPRTPKQCVTVLNTVIYEHCK